MSYRTVFPEVAGGWGPGTEFTRSLGQRTEVQTLHYVFEGWLGDELLESGCCYIVTDRLAQEIQGHGLSGFELRRVDITTSQLFRDLYPDRQLPRFHWLHIVGEAGRDDFGEDAQLRLVMSEKAFLVCKATHLQNCEIVE